MRFVLSDRLKHFEYSNFLSKVCEGQTTTESHVGGDAQSPGHRTDQKNFQQNGTKGFTANGGKKAKVPVSLSLDTSVFNTHTLSAQMLSHNYIFI